MTFQSPPPKKPSFLRRLSLSSQPQPVIHVANVTTATGFPAVGTKNTLQSTSGPSKKNLLAGPAYEAIPSRPAPSAFRGVEQATSVNKEIEDRSRLKASASK